MSKDLLLRSHERRLLGRHVIYESAPPRGGQEMDNAGTHMISLTLVAGHHFPVGSAYFKDLTLDAASVLSTLTNAMQYLDVAGKAPMPQPGPPTTRPLTLRDAGLRYNVKTVMELVPSEPLPKQNGSRVLAAVRFHWLLRERDTHHQDIAQGGNGDGEGGQPPVAEGRGGGGGAGATRREQRQAQLARIREVARISPLDYALAHVFAESTAAINLVQRKRAAHVKANRTKMGEVPATVQARTDIPWPSLLPEYRFAAFENMKQFLFHGIQKFYRPQETDKAPAENDPCPTFLNLVEGNNDSEEAMVSEYNAANFLPAEMHAYRSSPLNGSTIFSLERALHYMMVGGTYPIAPECRRLSSYKPGCHGQPDHNRQQQQQQQPNNNNNNNRNNRQLPQDRRRQRRPPQPRLHSVDSDGDVEMSLLQEDSDNDDALGTSAQLDESHYEDGEEEEEEEGGDVNTTHGNQDDDDANDDESQYGYKDFPSLRSILLNNGQHYHNDIAQPSWPFPRLTSCLSTLAGSEVLLSVVRLPYAIGDVLPEEAFKPLGANEPLPAFCMPKELKGFERSCLEAIARLRRMETINDSTVNATVGATNTTGPAATATDTTTPGQVEATITAKNKLTRRIPAVLGTPVVHGAHGATRTLFGDVFIENVQDPIQTLATILAGTNPPRQLAQPRQEQQQPEVPADVDAARQELAVLQDIIPPDLLLVRDRQLLVVRRAFSELAKRFRERAYAELDSQWSLTMEEPSRDDYMPLTEFHPPESVHYSKGLSPLARVRRQYEEFKGDFELSPMDDRSVIAAIDIIPDWVLERCQPLEERGALQMQQAVMRIQQRNELTRIKSQPNTRPKERRRLIEEAEARHALARDAAALTRWQQLDEVFSTMKRASPALLKVRDYYQKHVYPNRDTVQVKPVNLDARPYVVTRQMYTNHYKAVELVSKQNYPYMERAHTFGHHCMRWMPRRMDPALNYTMVGESGIGKSFCLNIMKELTPDGVVNDTTTETTASYNVDQDFDGHVVVYQEMDSALLFSNKSKNDTGSTDKINFAKQRMTSYFTRVKYFDRDEQTGKRMAKECFSSQHIVTMGATNQKLEDMDKNMKRRLLIDYVSAIVNESDGGQAHEMDRPMETPDVTYRMEQARGDMRELFCAYTYVETAIKMAVQPDLNMNTARAFLSGILKEARALRGVNISSKGHRTWVLETARILTIQHACYMALYSPTGQRLYDLGVLKRWSPAMFCKLVAPNLIITKDAVQHAVEMLDFLYCSRDEDRLFATIALRCCNLANMEKWRFRREAGGNGQQGSDDDYNYLSFAASNKTQLTIFISECHKDIGLFRPEDIRPQLKGYEKLRRPTQGLERIAGPNGETLGLRRGGRADDRPAIIFDYDAYAATKKQSNQFCISIEFLESRFGFDICADSAETIRRKIESREKTIDATLLHPDREKGGDRTQAYLELNEIMASMDTRAPLVKSIRNALSTPTLEKSPYEHDTYLPVPAAVKKYWSPYLPEDIQLTFKTAGTGGITTSVRVPVDGVCMLLEAERNPKGKYLTLANYTKPTPTARLALYHGLTDEQMPEMSRGFIYDKYDIDYMVALEQMESAGHPGFPELHQVFIEACLSERDFETYPGVEGAELFKKRLFEAIPELDPAAGVPLPFAFPPIAYRIEQYLARHVYNQPLLEDYPACVLYSRLQDTVMRLESEASDNGNHAYQSMSERFAFDDRRKAAIRKRKRQAGIEDSVDVEEEGPVVIQPLPPAKRRRLNDDAAIPLVTEPLLQPVDEMDAMDIDNPPSPPPQQSHPRPRVVVVEEEEDEEEEEDSADFEDY